MSVTEHTFRTAAFGGFQKQDVLTYIEETTRANSEKAEGLEQALKAEQESRQALERKETERSEEARLLTEENQRLTQELESARAELCKTGDKLKEAEKTVKEQKARLDKTEPEAQAYESIKDRTAGVELDAHHRAQVIEDEAKVKAKATRQELEGWIYKVQGGYERMRAELTAAIAGANVALEQAGDTVNSLTEQFDSHDGALEALLKAYREANGPVAPAPLPLDEA